MKRGDLHMYSKGNYVVYSNYGIFTLFLGQKIDTMVNGIICAMLVVPLGYIGVFKKNGMDFFEYYREKKKQTG